MKYFNKFTPHTLRSKLTLLLVSTILFISAAFFSISALITQFTLNNQIDHHIHIMVLEAKRVVETYQNEQRLETLKSLVGAQGMTIVLLSTDGSAILQTNSPDVAIVSEHQLQQIMIASSNSQEPYHFTIDSIRFATLPVYFESGPGILAVGFSTSIINQTIRTLSIALGGTVLITLIIVVFIAIKLLNQLLKPLNFIEQTALSITNSNKLSKRITSLPKSKELKNIVLAINTMLHRLEQIFQTEHNFFADAAHTLKTPLAVLRSQIEINNKITPTAKSKMFSVIDQAAQNIKHLIMISLVETQGVKNNTISLSQLLEELVELAAVLGSSKKITVKSQLQPNVIIRGDSSLLTRAFSNLIKNAVEHTSRNGLISINLKKTKREVLVIIKDTGVGIKNQDLPRIFDRFYKGQDAKKTGTGLGLAIVKTVLDKHQAKIKVDSKPNKGTAFTISFKQEID